MILKDIYGYDKIYKQKPFLIEKDFESWTVSGSGEDSLLISWEEFPILS